jgi:glycosyltransferase involved in cell wall biosynthesis
MAQVRSGVTLSVVVPTFDARATLPDLLESLASQTYDGSWEVVVADNGSGDDTTVIAESYRDRLPDLQVIDASARRGPGHARNEGARAARGEKLLFVDSDDTVGAGWLAAMARALDEHDFVASRFETDLLNDLWLRQTRRTAEAGERLSYWPFLEHAGGSGMGVERELFLAAGGFDESLPVVQDADLCIRLQLAGTPLVHVPDAVVHVRYRTRFREIYRQGRAYAWDNARLQARYSNGGPHAPDWWKWPLRHWLAIARAAIRAHDRGSRARLAWAVGWQVGRVGGSLRYRVPAK